MQNENKRNNFTRSANYLIDGFRSQFNDRTLGTIEFLYNTTSIEDIESLLYELRAEQQANEVANLKKTRVTSMAAFLEVGDILGELKNAQIATKVIILTEYKAFVKAMLKSGITRSNVTEGYRYEYELYRTKKMQPGQLKLIEDRTIEAIKEMNQKSAVILQSLKEKFKEYFPDANN